MLPLILLAYMLATGVIHVSRCISLKLATLAIGMCTSVSRTSLTNIIAQESEGVYSASACLCAGAFWGYAWWQCGYAAWLGSMQIQSRPFPLLNWRWRAFISCAALSAPSPYSLVPRLVLCLVSCKPNLLRLACLSCLSRLLNMNMKCRLTFHLPCLLTCG